MLLPLDERLQATATLLAQRNEPWIQNLLSDPHTKEQLLYVVADIHTNNLKDNINMPFDLDFSEKKFALEYIQHQI